MRFQSAELARHLIGELRGARSVSIAVAYFNPDPATLAELKKVPNLRLVVSDDFAVNDPHKLESLKNAADMRFIPSESDAGKLHAKVFIVHRKNGTRWVMVGSANLTGAGLLDNQEACICVDSSEQNDGDIADGIEIWFKQVIERSEEIDFDRAKRIFAARSNYHWQPRASASQKESGSAEGHGFWALKTTEGSYGTSHWQDFQAENVIAIGWPGLGVNPSRVTDKELARALTRSYPRYKKKPRGTARVISKMRMFIDEMGEGDLVLICRGYPSQSKVKVHIFGIARVLGPFFEDTKSSWWRFKRRVAIQVIEQKIPRSILASTIERDSLRETIHNLDQQPFERALGLFADRFGFHLAV